MRKCGSAVPALPPVCIARLPGENQVHPANVASYDGYSACDEIQFPLHMAIRANTPELRQKFVDLLLVRFHICGYTDPHALERLPRPVYDTIRKLLKQSSKISAQILINIASDFPSLL